MHDGVGSPHTQAIEREERRRVVMSKLERTFSIRGAFEKKSTSLTPRNRQSIRVQSDQDARRGQELLFEDSRAHHRVKYDMGEVCVSELDSVGGICTKIRPASGGKQALLVS